MLGTLYPIEHSRSLSNPYLVYIISIYENQFNMHKLLFSICASHPITKEDSIITFW
jgi:hypothetical protein